MNRQIPLEKGEKKLINAWAFYDWANSVYPLVISSTIFPIYFTALSSETKTIAFLGFDFKNTALISFVTAMAFIIVAFNSPLLSGIADYIGNKKRFMKIFVYTGSLSCIGLYWFDLQDIYVGMAFYFFALIGFWASLVFYNSYLPDIAYPEQQDKGEAAMKAMKYSFVAVGIWWALFSQYTFYHLPKGNSNSGKVTKDVIWNGFQELKIVWNQLGDNPNLKRFLPAFFIYNTALQTVMLIAAYFGEEEIQWGSNQEKTIGLIVSIMLIQIIAILGAFLTAHASKRFGNILTLIVINVIWAGLCVYAYVIQTPVEFYFAAAGVGMVMGGLQALSRSTYSKLIPKTKDTTSFFSFYDVAEKVGIVFGMVMFGTIDQLTGSMRNSILFFLVLFIAGALMLTRIPNRSGDPKTT